MKKLFVLVCLLAIGFCNVAWAAKRQAKHVVFKTCSIDCVGRLGCV